VRVDVFSPEKTEPAFGTGHAAACPPERIPVLANPSLAALSHVMVVSVLGHKKPPPLKHEGAFCALGLIALASRPHYQMRLYMEDLLNRERTA